MRIHYLQHVPFENPAYIINWGEKNGHPLSSTKLYSKFSFPSFNEFDFLVVMGGPMSVHDTKQYPWLNDETEFIKRVIDEGKPVLGICLGSQLIAKSLGSDVYKNTEKEIGWFPVYKTGEAGESNLSNVLPDKITAFHWHGDTFDIPDGAVRLYKSDVCKNQAFIYNEKVMGFQFHPEVTETSVNSLVNNCGDEITEAPYIQSAEEILSGENYIPQLNKMIGSVLNYFSALSF